MNMGISRLLALLTPHQKPPRAKKEFRWSTHHQISPVPTFPGRFPDPMVDFPTPMVNFPTSMVNFPTSWSISRPWPARAGQGRPPWSIPPKTTSSQKRSHRNSGQNRPIERSPALTGTIFVTISAIVIRSHFRATFSQLLDNFRTLPDNFRATFGPNGQQIRGETKLIYSILSPRSRWECRGSRIGGGSTIRNRMLEALGTNCSSIFGGFRILPI